MNTRHGRAHVIREVDNPRRFIRVRMPAWVVVGDTRHPVADWSLGGMAVEDAAAHWTIGQRFQAQVVFAAVECSLVTEVACQVVYATAQRVGVRFLDLREEQIGLLRHLMEAHLSGRVASVNGLIGSAAHRVPARATGGADGQVPPLEGKKILASVQRLLRFAVLLALGGAVLALAAAVVYSYFFTADAVLAAVVGSSFDIRAPLDGRLSGSALQPGKRLKPGDVLFTVRSDALEHELRTAGADLEREEARLTSLYEALRDRQAFFVEYLVAADAEHRKAQAESESAKATLELAKRRQQRMAELYARELVAVQQVEDESKAVAMAEMENRRAEAAQVQQESNTRMAGQSRYYTGSRLEGGEPGEIEREIKLAQSSINVARSKVKALSAQIDAAVVRAPCDCLLHAVGAQPGEWVAKGHVVYTLHGDHQGLLLEALVLQETASAIPIGTTADILLADRDRVLSGQVVDVNRTGPREKRAGLPVPPGESDRYALILVVVPDGPHGAPAGLPARVKFRLRRAVPFLVLGPSNPFSFRPGPRTP